MNEAALAIIEYSTPQGAGYVTYSIDSQGIFVSEYSVEFRGDLNIQHGESFTDGFIFGVLSHLSLPVRIDPDANIWK